MSTTTPLSQPIRRRTALSLAGASAFSALALSACGGGSESSSDKALTELTAMVPLFAGQAPADDGFVTTAVEDFIGIGLDVDWVPGANYYDRITTSLASGDFPALLIIENPKYPAFVQAAQAGAFWDLTDILRDYPNLTPEDEDVYEASTINGVAYGIYLWRDPSRSAISLRKDWLDALGLALPETTDDLFTIAQAFTEEDPAGTGDTRGLILSSWSPLGAGTPYDAVETWFGSPNRWGEVDGLLTPSFTSDGFMEANRYLRSMVEAGFVNEDFATFDGANWDDPFLNGKGGIIIDTGSRAKGLMEKFRQQEPEDYGNFVTAAPQLTGPSGTRTTLPTNGFGGILAISTTAVPTEERLHEVLTILDKLSSEEGQTLMINGVEGETFTRVDEEFAEPIVEDEADEIIQTDLSSFGMLNTASNGKKYLTKLPSGDASRELVHFLEDQIPKDLEDAVRNPALKYFSPLQAERGAQLDNIVSDARMKFLVGQIDESQLSGEIDRWFAEGGQQIVDELNALHQAE